MKTWIIFTGLAIFLLHGCKKSEIITYESESYLQFARSLSDSVTVSFTFFPETNTLEWPVEVVLLGTVSDKERSYRLEVDKELSTALEGTHVELPGNMVLKPGAVRDTCKITFIKTPEMSSRDFRLVLHVVENENFSYGQPNHLYNILRVNDKVSKPDWWTSRVVSSYLGGYSDKKFTLFIRETGMADMTGKDDSEMWAAALKFKYWLQREKLAGNTIMEDDNVTEMTVPVIG